MLAYRRDYWNLRRKNPAKSSKRECEKLCQKLGKPLQKMFGFEPEPYWLCEQLLQLYLYVCQLSIQVNL